jgi:hypothetical protein
MRGDGRPAEQRARDCLEAPQLRLDVRRNEPYSATGYAADTGAALPRSGPAAARLIARHIGLCQVSLKKLENNPMQSSPAPTQNLLGTVLRNVA